MIYKLTYTTNSGFQDYVGLSGNVSILENGSFYFETGFRWLRSSYVESIEETDTEVTYKTMNSVYKFSKEERELTLGDLRDSKCLNLD